MVKYYSHTYFPKNRELQTACQLAKVNNHDVQELWFQQDGATCHTARATINLLKDTFGDRLISRFGPVDRPPKSCDLTQLDYFLGGYVKSLVYAYKPQTLDHLEDNIRRVIADIRPQMLEKVIENWTSRLDYVRASCGSHMPEIIFKIQCKKPHTIAEELILRAAIEIVETMFGDNFAKELQSIPLSNDTVSRRIDDIAEDVEQQLFGKLRDKLFSIQLDEATDSNKDAHFIAYVRFWDGMSAVEELLFCKPIKLKATAIALFDILNNFINEANIEWKNCVGICTDGARTMSGRFKSIQALVKQKSPLCIWTHCMIHREALASKEISPGLNIVLMTVVTVVNYIKMRP
ncbi:SCAN domain-containing protein 3 [Trichonephila clavipes]|nr:SCAN domain-containing protein 3 [Trichonephila clavipes]